MVALQLTGSIPEEIASMPILYYLDLSINNLTGKIPQSFRYDSDPLRPFTPANLPDIHAYNLVRNWLSPFRLPQSY
jgi:hypothetical protein